MAIILQLTFIPLFSLSRYIALCKNKYNKGAHIVAIFYIDIFCSDRFWTSHRNNFPRFASAYSINVKRTSRNFLRDTYFYMYIRKTRKTLSFYNDSLVSPTFYEYIMCSECSRQHAAPHGVLSSSFTLPTLSIRNATLNDVARSIVRIEDSPEHSARTTSLSEGGD